MSDRRRSARFFAVLFLLAGASSAQIYHDTQYVAGGYQSSVASSSYAPGIWLVRPDGTAITVALPGYHTIGFCMDTDNWHIVAACSGTSHASFGSPQYGIYRFNPATRVFTTVYGPNRVTCHGIFNLHVDQDGDYVFNACKQIGTTRYLDHHVYKLLPGGKLRTLLSSAILGRQTLPFGAVGTDIDTGKTLVADMFGTSTFRYPIWEIASDGTIGTWSSGIPSGYYGQYKIPQNHTTGCIEGPDGVFLYRLKPGSGHRTTIATVQIGSSPVPGPVNSLFDLQSAPVKRWVGTGEAHFTTNYGAWINYLAPDGKLTSVRVTDVGSRRLYPAEFEFYRGNHVQTVKTGTNRWTIRLSCPRSPALRYVLAAGVSGVRPGIPLPDGRKIHLNVDPVVQATIQNQLPGVWHPGRGVLDAGGEARGMLDLSQLPVPPRGFGVALWIALVVLDPKAPCGIRYIPDTWVMRV